MDRAALAGTALMVPLLLPALVAAQDPGPPRAERPGPVTLLEVLKRDSERTRKAVLWAGEVADRLRAEVPGVPDLAGKGKREQFRSLEALLAEHGLTLVPRGSASTPLWVVVPPGGTGRLIHEFRFVPREELDPAARFPTELIATVIPRGEATEELRPSGLPGSLVIPVHVAGVQVVRDYGFTLDRIVTGARDRGGAARGPAEGPPGRSFGFQMDPEHGLPLDVFLPKLATALGRAVSWAAGGPDTGPRRIHGTGACEIPGSRLPSFGQTVANICGVLLLPSPRAGDAAWEFQLLPMVEPLRSRFEEIPIDRLDEARHPLDLVFTTLPLRDLLPGDALEVARALGREGFRTGFADIASDSRAVRLGDFAGRLAETVKLIRHLDEAAGRKAAGR